MKVVSLREEGGSLVCDAWPTWTGEDSESGQGTRCPPAWALGKCQPSLPQEK